MGQIDSILAFFGWMLPYTAKYIAGFLKFILLYTVLVCSWSFLAGTGTSFAQSCSAAAVQIVNDKLDLPGRKGSDVLQIKFNSVNSIICRPRFGDARSSIAGSIRIAHCTPGNTTDLCFAMKQDTVLQSATIFGPGLVGGLSVTSSSPVDLSAGTYQVDAIVNGDTVGFSFTIVELADDNQRIVPETIPISISLPNVSIANTTETLEAGTNGLITISQTVLSSVDNVISYTVTGTATAGSDYTALSGSLVILGGDKSATITVPVIDDSTIEGNETVVITLTDISSGFAMLGSSSSATNTIIDDDTETNKIIARKFQTQAHNFISRRMTLQSFSSPSIHRRVLESTQREKKFLGSLNLSGSEQGAFGSLSFANTFQDTNSDCETCNNPFFWFELEFSYFRDRDFSDLATRSSGNYYVGYAGISFPVDEYLTLGIMGQIDRFEDNLDNGLGQVKGSGWAFGPYFSTQVFEQLRLDIRGLWGQSENKANQSIFGSDFSGSFETERWLVEGILSGTHHIDEYSFKPSARLFYMNENWESFKATDSTRTVEIKGSEAELGSLAAALEIIKTLENENLTIETFLSGEILWNFQDPGIFDSTGEFSQSNDFSGSISAGIEISNENSGLRLEADYSGFGQGGVESIGGSLTLSHRF